MEDLIKHAALDEFSEAISLLNYLVILDCDNQSMNLRMRLLENRHDTNFTAKMAELTSQWQLANKHRRSLVEVLRLDWLRQRPEVKTFRSKIHLHEDLTASKFPAELTASEQTILRQLQS